MDLDGILAVVRSAAEEAVPGAGRSVPAELADIAIIGASFVRDSVLKAMDLTEWDKLDATDLDDHKERVEVFCLEHCPVGQRSEPGQEVECEECPLAPLLVEVLAAQIARAMERA